MHFKNRQSHPAPPVRPRKSYSIFQNISNLINLNVHRQQKLFSFLLKMQVLVFPFFVLSSCGGSKTSVTGEQTYYLCNVEINTEAEMFLCPSGGYRYYDPEFSPSGDKVVFTKASTYIPAVRVTGNYHPWLRQQIVVYDKTSKNLQFLTDSVRNSQLPTWSPDGSLILYFSDKSTTGGSANDGYGGHIWKMNPDGSQKQYILKGHHHHQAFRVIHLTFSLARLLLR